MIFNKIKRKFIIVAMSSVSLVLLLSVGTINIINYSRIAPSSDEIIEQVERDQPEPAPVNPPPKPGEVGDNSYFIISFKNDEYLIVKNTMHAMKDDEIIEIAKQIKSYNCERGFYEKYYRYHVSNNKIIALDCTTQFDVANRTLLISVFTSLGGMIVIFLLIFFFSNRILKPVKESYDKQKQFITNASHELKTPLTIISANNELIEMKQGTSQYSDNISIEVAKMNKMVKDLINYSKMSEEIKIHKEKFNLDSLVNALINKYRIVYEDLNIKFNSKIQKQVEINSDKEVIKQMISIILDNSRKYAKSFVNIELYNNKNSIIFSESNDSINPIDSVDLKHYTERFYRATNNKNENEGSGIGLAILNEQANKIKCKLKIYGENNIFHISLIFNKNFLNIS